MIYQAYGLTDDAPAAMVLLRLAFRFGQALNADREDTAQSHNDLMAETGFTYKMIKGAVKRLKDRGLIEYKQKLFANKNVNHYRLTEKAMTGLKGSPKEDPHGSPKADPHGSPGQPPQGLLYIQGETTGSDNKESATSELALATLPGQRIRFTEEMKR
jgi:hypothetical protein